jgi:hypothetical protein
MNKHVTCDQTSKQTFDLLSCRIKACKLPSIRGKANKKATNKKRQIFKESPSILRAIKNIYTNCKRNADVENENDTRHYKTNIK